MTTDSPQPLWHFLPISDRLDLELAAALAESVPLLAWQPLPSLLPDRTAPGSEAERVLRLSPANSQEPLPCVRVRSLPLVRGYARLPLSRAPLSWIARTESAVLERLLRQTPEPELSPLLCTTPALTPVAERWPGPVVYRMSDEAAASSPLGRGEALRRYQRLCGAATLVCPSSEALGHFLIDHVGCDPDKLEVVPHATRASNLLPSAPAAAAEPPIAAQGILRPIAGVVGDLAGEIDWLLLADLVKLTPWLSWVFVGPVSLPIADPATRQARAEVLGLPNTTFLGRQPETSMAALARCFDVAVLPCGDGAGSARRHSCSASARLYEHLAACRPILATRGGEELTRETPLLTLFATAAEGFQALEALNERGFDDGLLGERWQASRQGTWQARARTLQQALAVRMRRPPAGEIAA